MLMPNQLEVLRASYQMKPRYKNITYILILTYVFLSWRVMDVPWMYHFSFGDIELAQMTKTPGQETRIMHFPF